MKPGNRVKICKVWKYDRAEGTIEKITSEYVVVKWDGIPGHWHYTKEQAEKLEVLDVAD